MVAITDSTGAVTDTFAYDTYGNLESRTGDSFVIFGYNGRDGVVTDKNGLIYMRARYYSPEMRRFVNADILRGEISDSTSLNRYSYVNGNPVSFVDPFGLSKERGQGPSALEAAYMAQHIYDATISSKNKYLGENFNGWTLDDILIDDNGFKMGVYKRISEDGKIEYTVVNKGSTTKDDWLDNFKQPIGVSRDMMTSISIAKEFVNANENAHITFVGHSKGGGEALANAKATNKDVIVFNPAIPNYRAYGLGDSKYTAKATSYVMAGEMLSSAYILSEAIALNPCTYMTTGFVDDFIALASRVVFYSKPFWQTLWLPNEDWSPVEDHSIESMIKALSDDD